MEVRNSSDLRGTFGIESILLKRTCVWLKTGNIRENVFSFENFSSGP